ncbi:MAG TPA: class I SAM-dependent methyltransferase [Pyrinomonadaceae bacterium]|nr:class I SAM-dependent methyltransferase [Pyrinomonadaceae bacterium]
MNFFSFESAARRYAKGRTYFHPLIVERIRNFLSTALPLERAIDVGCGTGLSTIALKEIAASVVGIDMSREMIALAEPDERILYAVADAVKLPFKEAEFDLMTLSSAFHWLDRRAFLKEAARVLRPKGWLVVYDHYFSGQMEESPEFQTWYRETHLQKYPAPPRAGLDFTEEDSGNEGLHLARHDRYQNSVGFSIEGLIDYLLTHSNVIAAVEGGTEEIGEVGLRLRENLEPIYGDLKEATFAFHGPVWYLQKRA